MSRVTFTDAFDERDLLVIAAHVRCAPTLNEAAERLKVMLEHSWCRAQIASRNDVLERVERLLEKRGGA